MPADATPPANRSRTTRHVAVRVQTTGSATTVTVAGELDDVTTPALASALGEVVAGRGERLVVDLSAVTRIELAGVAALTGAWSKMDPHRSSLCVVGASPRIAAFLAEHRAGHLLGRPTTGRGRAPRPATGPRR